MRTTARFELERRKQLKGLFTEKRLAALWRNLVRDQMRGMDIKDLHDYYDFNYAVEIRVQTIIEKVLSGHYRADVPVVYRVEKKLGVCRHMMQPSPADALVFQLLTEALYQSIMRAQPSKGAYYARDRHTLKLPHEHKQAGSYPWFVLWPKFQKEIWNFSKQHKFLITTDLTNYFDNIGLRELRHVVSSIVRPPEVFLDLLFSLIEDLSWTPDYLPRSQKGLPTIHIEAPRLLAHALLFEVDYILKRRTKNSFVRWMDDINFGVDDPREARRILGEISDVLKSRGLALNLGKTDVISAKDAESHFLFRENLRLSKLQEHGRRLKSANAKQKFAKKVADDLKLHLAHCKARNKDKITRRLLNLAGSLGYPVGIASAKEVFSTQPGLRSSVLRFLSRLPFGKRVGDAFVGLLKETHLYDDATRFAFVEALVTWNVPYNTVGKSFVRTAKKVLRKPDSAFDWLCYIFFLCKYGEPHEVLNELEIGKKKHSREAFFARQGVCALPRGLAINPTAVERQLEIAISSGVSDAASAASNIVRFLDQGFPPKNDRAYFYLFPQKPQTPYPIAKFLLLCVIGAAEAKKRNKLHRREVKEHVKDPWFRHWLQQIHPHWF
jgi:hypothetical protein